MFCVVPLRHSRTHKSKIFCLSLDTFILVADINALEKDIRMDLIQSLLFNSIQIYRWRWLFIVNQQLYVWHEFLPHKKYTRWIEWMRFGFLIFYPTKSLTDECEWHHHDHHHHHVHEHIFCWKCITNPTHYSVQHYCIVHTHTHTHTHTYAIAFIQNIYLMHFDVAFLWNAITFCQKRKQQAQNTHAHALSNHCTI